MGSLGQYVYAAYSMKHLYKLILKGDEYYKGMFLWDCRKDRFLTYPEFVKNWSKWIGVKSLKCGLLGGYSE